jgi:hypothetical protein
VITVFIRLCIKKVHNPDPIPPPCSFLVWHMVLLLNIMERVLRIRTQQETFEEWDCL